MEVLDRLVAQSTCPLQQLLGEHDSLVLVVSILNLLDSLGELLDGLLLRSQRCGQLLSKVCKGLVNVLLLSLDRVLESLHAPMDIVNFRKDTIVLGVGLEQLGLPLKLNQLGSSLCILLILLAIELLL